MVINGNRICKFGNFWRVESATGEWCGYELYDTEEEAIEAANMPNSTEEE